MVHGTIDFACAFDMGINIQDFDLVFRVYLHDVKCVREDLAYSVSGLAAEAWIQWSSKSSSQNSSLFRASIASTCMIPSTYTDWMNL
jgi:hypothetical protein